jgi:fermentation-respiration switch protein FrsA (DUF1100 family)
MAGHLFLPASYRAGHKLPLAVVVGPWTTVKEQVADRYARELSERGVAALTFDFRHFGQSGGTPRQYESPARKVNDIHAAARFANALPLAQPGRVGGLSVCFGVGYMAQAIAEGAPLSSFATVAAWVHDYPTVVKTFGKAEVARRLRVGKEARQAFDRNGAVRYVPAASNGDKTAAMFGVDYYSSTRRGVVPQWTNRYAVLGWPEWIHFNGLAPASRISAPTLVVHSDKSALPDKARQFYSKLRGPKKLAWLVGNHTDFYDREPQVNRAAEAVAAHFRRTLAQAPRA